MNKITQAQLQAGGPTVVDAINALIDNHSDDGTKRSKRQAAIDGLVEGAADTPAKALVDAIFKRFAVPTTEFIQTGSPAILEAMRDETDPTMLAYLSTALSEHPDDTVLRRITISVFPLVYD